MQLGAVRGMWWLCKRTVLCFDNPLLPLLLCLSTLRVLCLQARSSRVRLLVRAPAPRACQRRVLMLQLVAADVSPAVGPRWVCEAASGRPLSLL